jgi:hypothetical protein
MASGAALGKKLLAWPIIIGAVVVSIGLYWENQESGSVFPSDVAGIIAGVGLGFIALTLL